MAWCFLFFSILPLTANPVEMGRVVASIDQRLVSERDLDFWILEARLSDPLLWEVSNEELRPQFLPAVIHEILLADWAELELEPLPDELVRERTQQLMTRFQRRAGGVLRLNDYLTDSGLVPEELIPWLEQRARRTLLVEQAISSRLPMGTEDAQEGSPADASALRIGHLVVRFGSNQEAAWERALTISREISAGLAFERAVRLYSDADLGRDNGGDLGWLTHDELAKPLWDNAVKLTRGDTSLPILFNDAYHIIQLIDYETERQQRFQDALRREELRILREQREIRRIRLAEGYSLPELPTESSNQSPE